jgi:hypothetical protein
MMSQAKAKTQMSLLADPLGLEHSYNHDIDVLPDYAAKYPRIEKILRDERLITLFKEYDSEARRAKKLFHSFGLLSLLAGTLALLGVAIELMLLGLKQTPPMWLQFGSHMLAVISVLLVLVMRIAQFRRKWRLAVFFRERLRHWHFQRFLDGKLVEKALAAPSDYTREVDHRWILLLQNFTDGGGLMNEFLRKPGNSQEWFHLTTPYTDPAVLAEVIDALKYVRFSHQLRYALKQTSNEAEERVPNLVEKQLWSEAVASITLILAVAVSAVLLALPGLTPANEGDHHPVAVVLSAVALMLAVLSAASRAYRAGYTIPDEKESYDEYTDRVATLQQLMAHSQAEFLNALAELERESVDELRRFLRMKERATFLF